MKRTSAVQDPAVPERGGETDLGSVVTRERIHAYLDDLAVRGRSDDTIRGYAAKLESLLAYLPEDKSITRKTLPMWRESLLEQGFSPRTVNLYLSAANGLLGFLNRRDLQLVGQLETAPTDPPELTRNEYLRLLRTARTLGRERTYLLVKMFALTGLRVGELPAVTAEQISEGSILVTEGGSRRRVTLPQGLRRELLSYLQREGVQSGPVFRTRNGRAMPRTQVSDAIRALCRDARVDAEKGNPRCLRRLYWTTQEQIERGVRLLAEQAHERMLEEEQLSAGWQEAGG